MQIEHLYKGDKLMAMPTARVTRRLAPLAFSTGRQLVGGFAPKPPFVSVHNFFFPHISLHSFIFSLSVTFFLLNHYTTLEKCIISGHADSRGIPKLVYVCIYIIYMCGEIY